MTTTREAIRWLSSLTARPAAVPRSKRQARRPIEHLPPVDGHASVPTPPPIQHRTLAERAPEQVVTAVREAGVVGMGGGGFPTWTKLETRADWVLVNGCESEPLLTADHRVIEEHGDEVRCGMAWAMHAVGASRGRVVRGGAHEPYPMGYERELVRRVLGREIAPGRRPPDVGVVVINAQTARAICHAVCADRPLTARVITVEGGAVGRPGNYHVPAGTPVADVLRACDSAPERTAEVVLGGPMTGVAAGADAKVTATTIGVLALTTRDLARHAPGPCIRCGRCAEVCPLGLPAMALADRPGPGARLCIGCGACQYVCPARRPLVALIRDARAGEST